MANPADTKYTSELFNETDPTGLQFTDLGGLAKFLVPAGTGAVDVVYNYPWTLTPPAGRTETPFAVLTEFRLLQSAFLTSARYFLQGLAQQVVSTKSVYADRMQGYAGLCDFNNPTGFHYTVPYFSDVSSEVQSSWTSLDFLEKIKGAASFVGAGEFVEKLEKLYTLRQELTYPRVGQMDRPKLWESSTPRTINVKFPLFNTISVTDIKKNWDLCYLLMYQNMFNKRDFITAIPPVFYTVHIPGQFFSIAMYVSDLKIYNRGNIRRIDVGGKFRNIPDVYEIDMSLTDMLMPSQNMMAELLQDQPVNVYYRDDKGNVLSDVNPAFVPDQALQLVGNFAGGTATTFQGGIQTVLGAVNTGVDNLVGNR
jgi:hypothetical protein